MPTVIARPVLFSSEFAEFLGLSNRAYGEDVAHRTCVVDMTEDEILAMGASKVEWGKPDAHGRYTPTLYSKAPEVWP